MTPTLRFLGASDSQGVPRWWCDCKVCTEARTTGVNARSRPSVVIEGAAESPERVLVDASPELRTQCAREGLRGFGAALISHAHNDHVLGLGDLADRARWTREPCPVFAPAEVLPALRERFAYLTRGGYPERVPFRALEQSSRTFAGYRLSAVRVPHGFNGWAYGFRFDGESSRPGSSWAYIPDSLNLQDLSPWRGLGLLVLGTSCYRETAPVHSRSVYDVQEALGLISELKPAGTVLTHLGHGVDAREPAPEGTIYAYDGLRLELPW
jgi:phosphoribosyl 1,2-cyclic phosphate phosphodiesterase